MSGYWSMGGKRGKRGKGGEGNKTRVCEERMKTAGVN